MKSKLPITWFDVIGITLGLIVLIALLYVGLK